MLKRCSNMVMPTQLRSAGSSSPILTCHVASLWAARSSTHTTAVPSTRVRRRATTDYLALDQQEAIKPRAPETGEGLCRS